MKGSTTISKKRLQRLAVAGLVAGALIAPAAAQAELPGSTVIGTGSATASDTSSVPKFSPPPGAVLQDPGLAVEIPVTSFSPPPGAVAEAPVTTFSPPPGASIETPPVTTFSPPPGAIVQAPGASGVDFGDLGLGALAGAIGALLLAAAAFIAVNRRRRSVVSS